MPHLIHMPHLARTSRACISINIHMPQPQVHAPPQGARHAARRKVMLPAHHHRHLHADTHASPHTYYTRNPNSTRHPKLHNTLHAFGGLPGMQHHLNANTRASPEF